MQKDVENFINACETCQQEKLTRIRSKETPIIPDIPINPNNKIAMDIFRPLTKTKNGNQFILSIQDVTKYLVLIPLQNQQANSIINQLLKHYIYLFSAPKTILTDNGTNFVSKLMDAFENAFKIKHIKTTSFHPQSNGSIERTQGTVKDMIRTCCLDKRNEWDENLKLICISHSVHETTGFTPFELTFGRTANMSAISVISVTSNLTKEQLFKLWKNRHETYIRKAIEITNRNNESKQSTVPMQPAT
jgi:transposase InsO family protein